MKFLKIGHCIINPAFIAEVQFTSEPRRHLQLILACSGDSGLVEAPAIPSVRNFWDDQAEIVWHYLSHASQSTDLTALHSPGVVGQEVATRAQQLEAKLTAGTVPVVDDGIPF